MTTNFHAATYRADDIDRRQADELYADLITDHAMMSDDELRTRIAEAHKVALDSITYGYQRSIAAKRIGEHARMVLSMRKIEKVAA